MTDILKSLFENGDKIGVGVIAIASLFIIFILTRQLLKFVEKDREKDDRIYSLQEKTLDTASSMKDAAYSIRDASDRVADAQEAQIEASKQFPNLVASVISAIDNSSVRLTDSLNSGMQSLSNKITESEIKMLNALQSADMLAARKGVIVIDKDGDIISCNNDACILTGIPPETLLGSNVRDWAENTVYSDGTTMEHADIPFTEALVTARPFRNAVVGFQRDDKTRWFLMDAEPVIHLANKKVSRIIISFRDIGTLLFLAKQHEDTPDVIQSNTRVTQTIRQLPKETNQTG